MQREQQERTTKKVSDIWNFKDKPRKRELTEKDAMRTIEAVFKRQECHWSSYYEWSRKTKGHFYRDGSGGPPHRWGNRTCFPAWLRSLHDLCACPPLICEQSMSEKVRKRYMKFTSIANCMPKPPAYEGVTKMCYLGSKLVRQTRLRLSFFWGTSLMLK